MKKNPTRTAIGCFILIIGLYLATRPDASWSSYLVLLLGVLYLASNLFQNKKSDK